MGLFLFFLIFGIFFYEVCFYFFDRHFWDGVIIVRLELFDCFIEEFWLLELVICWVGHFSESECIELFKGQVREVRGFSGVEAAIDIGVYGGDWCIESEDFITLVIDSGKELEEFHVTGVVIGNDIKS